MEFVECADENTTENAPWRVFVNTINQTQNKSPLYLGYEGILDEDEFINKTKK